ncbi:class I SAM-dependent methyltransferase [Branchiibius sp. NY16-3462-2]|uniref:class I SAM-dependent methyltransferase n=1 Tax=Branchiibius sp. NY16-3462-2 TaxID=1807500 RepID=UPI0007979446|nr:class I SAM-dependent methyltransferase [Branchiibius sp. NY16-3462-2]KYH44688.1 SAM-dependent methyltransferase [Branchiibius sp. NY16-3462-2]
MSFEVSRDAYGRFMGRFSEPLAIQFTDWVAPQPGQRALDVGCGPGALTAVLADRLGSDAVVAVDPSETFVRAVRGRLPGVDARVTTADRLPFDEDTFDLALAQLVVHFMPDPVAGLREMARVTRAGGIVAANVWDLATGRAPISLFWRAVRELDPTHPGESGLPGVGAGSLTELFEQAGLDDVAAIEQTVQSEFGSFDEWWESYTLGIGPPGVFLASLDQAHRDAVRDRCRAILPPAPFTVPGTAWSVRGRVRP